MHKTFKTHDSDGEPELCGIEFFSRKEYKRFLALNPLLQASIKLVSKNKVIVLAQMRGFPTRDIAEFFDSKGRTIGKFIGPDALQWTYQIRFTEPGEAGGYSPEAFR